MRSFSGKLIVCLAGIALLTFSDSSRAYYDPVHYHFTYYLARAVGYTPMQSYRIASGAVAIDWDKNTEPVQQDNQFDMWSGAASAMGIDFVLGTEVDDLTEPGSTWEEVRDRYVAPASVPRIRFHAMMDCLNWPKCHYDDRHTRNAVAAIEVERRKRWNDAIATGNPGAYLHFVQDIPAHDGYPSDNGHWTAIDIWWKGKLLPMGSRTDYLDFSGPDGTRNTRGHIDDWLETLMNFMRDEIPSQHPRKADVHSRHPEIDNVYQALRQANLWTNSYTFQEAGYSAGKDFWAREAEWGHAFPMRILRPLNLLAAGIEFGLLWKVIGEPRNQPAYAAITAGLRNDLQSKFTEYKFTHFPYHFDPGGLPLGDEMLDAWTLYGDLEIKLDIIEHRESPRDHRGNLTVKVKAPATFEREQPYVIAEETTSGTSVEFQRLPVGWVSIEVYMFGKFMRSRHYPVNKRKDIIELTIDMNDDALQLLLDDYLRRMQLLQTVVRGIPDQFEAHEKQAERLLAEIRQRLAGIGHLLSDRARWNQLIAEIGELHSLAGQQNNWARQLRESAEIFNRAETQARSLACVSSHPDKREQLDELRRQVDAAAENAAASRAEYTDFAERLERAKFQVPHLALEHPELAGLFERARFHIDAMADLKSELDASKREANEIYEKVDSLLERKFEALRNVIENTGEDLAKTIEYYEDWLDLAGVILRELEMAGVDGERRVALREEFLRLQQRHMDLRTQGEEYREEFRIIGMPGLRAGDYAATQLTTTGFRDAYTRATRCTETSDTQDTNETEAVSDADAVTEPVETAAVDLSGYLQEMAALNADAQDLRSRSKQLTDSLLGGITELESVTQELTTELSTLDSQIDPVGANPDDSTQLSARVQQIAARVDEAVYRATEAWGVATSPFVCASLAPFREADGGLSREVVESLRSEYAAARAALPRYEQAMQQAQAALASLKGLATPGQIADSDNDAITNHLSQLEGEVQGMFEVISSGERIVSDAEGMSSAIRGMADRGGELLSTARSEAEASNQQNQQDVATMENLLAQINASGDDTASQHQQVTQALDAFGQQLRALQNRVSGLKQRANESRPGPAYPQTAGHIQQLIDIAQIGYDDALSKGEEIRQSLDRDGDCLIEADDILVTAVQLTPEQLCARDIPNSEPSGRRGDDGRILCSCKVGFEWEDRNTLTNCIPQVQLTPSELCARDIANSEPSGRRGSNGEVLCSCKAGFEWEDRNTLTNCIPQVQLTPSELCARDIANSEPSGRRGNNGEVLCSCKAGFEWADPNTRTACVARANQDGRDEVAQTDCSGFGMYSEAFWSERYSQARCRCMTGFHWNSGSTWCVPDNPTVFEEKDSYCKRYYAGTVAAWNERNQTYSCACPYGQLFDQNRLRCMNPGPGVSAQGTWETEGTFGRPVPGGQPQPQQPQQQPNDSLLDGNGNCRYGVSEFGDCLCADGWPTLLGQCSR